MEIARCIFISQLVDKCPTISTTIGGTQAIETIQSILTRMPVKQELATNIVSFFQISCSAYVNNVEHQWALLEQELKSQLFFERSKFSEVDPSRVITDEFWAISLVRKPDSTHHEHAFLIVEGKIGSQAKIWFIDFVGNPVLSGIGDGKIRFHLYEGHLENKLLFCCDRQMMDIRASDRILHTTWSAQKEIALELVQAIEQRMESIRAGRERPPKFNILGHRSVFAIGTGVTSSVTTGHNCFTWAKQQLRDLNDNRIVLPADDIGSWVFSATSRVLVDYQHLARRWYQNPCLVATVVGSVATVAGALIASNSETIKDMCHTQ